MNCPKCGTETEDNAKFCRRCYTRFDSYQEHSLKAKSAGISRQSKAEPGEPPNLVHCQDCGKEISRRADKCPHCGAPAERKTQKKGILKFTARRAIIFVGIVLVLWLFIGLEPFYRLFYRGIVNEYNQRLTDAQSVLQQHDELVNKINKSRSMGEIEKNRGFAKEYLLKVNSWGATLNDFKLFVESNDRRIRRVGINPDYLRDNVGNVLRIMGENELNFQRAIDIQDAFLKPSG